jgi:CBS domain-containing protein
MKAREIVALEVGSVSPDASIVEAVRLMLQNRISGLPVVDRQAMLLGVVTERDFLGPRPGRSAKGLGGSNS